MALHYITQQFIFLAGLVLIIGPKKTGAFFFRRSKWRGTLAFAIGMGLILYRQPFLGMAVEFFGFLNLFGYLFSIMARCKLIYHTVIFSPTWLRLLGRCPS